MAIAGRVAIVPKGDWSADAAYNRLDAVTYNNTLYFAKKEVPAGTATSNTEYWSKSIVGGVGEIATKEDAGIVKPADGLSIAEDGTLKVSIDGTTLTMDQVNNVIKLADTLKEKINGAFPAANLINNLTTTEAGFGLDARQGKALDDKITEINGSLINKLVLGQDNTLTSHQILENQTRLIQIVESNGNNALNKEVFGDHENFNNGFGCVFIFLKANDWRVSALAFPIARWGLDILPVGQNSGATSLKWSKISLSNL